MKIMVAPGDFYYPDNGLPEGVQSHFGGWIDNWIVQIERKNRDYLLFRHTFTYILMYFHGVMYLRYGTMET